MTKKIIKADFLRTSGYLDERVQYLTKNKDGNVYWNLDDKKPEHRDERWEISKYNAHLLGKK